MPIASTGGLAYVTQAGGGGGSGAAISIGGNTAGTAALVSSGTLVLAGGTNVTLSQSGSTVSIVGAAGAVGTGFTSSTTAGTALVGTLSSNGLSLGVPAWLTTQTNQTLASGGIAGTGSSVTGNASFTLNSNGLAFNGSGLAGTSTGATNASVTLNSSGIAISVAAGGGASTAGLYATGNTTQNSSTTLALSSLLFNGLGAMTVGYSNGSVELSAPATSSLIGAGGISVSTNVSTISVYENPVTRMLWPQGQQLTAVSAFGNGSISVQYVAPSWPVTASRLDALVSWSAGSAATSNTMGVALSAYAAIYTKNGSTLSSLSSGSTQTTYTYASNSAGAPLYSPAIRPVSVPVNVSMTPGEYFVAFNISTNSTSVGAATTNLGQTLSMMGGGILQTAANYAEITAATATSTNLFGGMGMYTATSAGIGASLGIASIAQTGSSLSQANIALVFRNA
jgi:hypothetical protein